MPGPPPPNTDTGLHYFKHFCNVKRRIPVLWFYNCLMILVSTLNLEYWNLKKRMLIHNNKCWRMSGEYKYKFLDLFLIDLDLQCNKVSWPWLWVRPLSIRFVIKSSITEHSKRTGASARDRFVKSLDYRSELRTYLIIIHQQVVWSNVSIISDQSY